MRARYGGGQCPLCEQKIEAGRQILRWGKDWAHLFCVHRERATGPIRRGETFAGRKPTSWRRKVKRD